MEKKRQFPMFDFPAAMGSSSVAAGLVLGHPDVQVLFTEDQHPVGHLRPGGEHKPSGISVRPRAPGRIFTASMPALARTASNDPVNCPAGLRSGNRKSAGPVTEVPGRRIAPFPPSGARLVGGQRATRLVPPVPQPRRRRVPPGPPHQQQPPGLHERPQLPPQQTPSACRPHREHERKLE
jgi:hypothetical protein